MLKICTALILSISFILCGCATVYNPATGQKEFIFVSTATEVSIGAEVAEKVARDFEISQDAEKNNLIEEIGERISSVSDRKDLKYHFFVIEDENLNAFTTPGGYIYINSGLIDKATPDELACVIGHEVGHVSARHFAKKFQAQMGYSLLMNIVTRKGGMKNLQRAASISYDFMMLGYSREDELLSDKLGVKYAYKAGYDPYSMISFLKKLKESKKEEMGVVFLRSHPYTSQRISFLEKQTPLVIEKVDKKIESPINAITARPQRVMCPSCKKIFPGRTNYCPYDGTKME